MNSLIEIEEKKSKKFFMISLSVFFAVIFTMNSILIYMATSSTNGLVNDNPYKYGINYNEVLDMKEFMTNIGYKTSFDYNNSDIIINISDNKGDIVADVNDLEIYMFHPINKKFDFITEYEIIDNMYIVKSPEFPVKGDWDAKIVHKYSGKTLETKHRFTID